MKFSDFPIEIKNKVKQRVEEEGNVYSERNFDVTISRDRFQQGFTWDRTVEGTSFWRNVLMDEIFQVFFDKYPKESAVSPYTYADYPKAAEVGSKWRVVDEHHYEHGAVVTLVKNDGSFRPYFKTKNCSSRVINWGLLMPYKEETEIKGFIPPTEIEKHLYHDIFRSNFPTPRCSESIEGQIYQQINVPQVRCGY